MNWTFFFARRYLFSRRSHNAINIISGISAVGIAVATLALVCTLSVFNGFQDLVAGLFTAFDPQLRVTLAEGRTIDVNDEALLRLEQMPQIEVLTPVLEDQALIVQDGKQTVVTIKGVADNYVRQANLEDLLYGDGTFFLQANGQEYGVLGIQVTSRLGLGATFEEPLQVYAPRRGERVNMANPLSSFNHAELHSPGVVFMVSQAEYDAHYILTSLDFARELFDQEGRVSAMEIRLREGEDVDRAKKEIRKVLGPSFLVHDRYEQQEDVFRIMRVEKLISYLFLTFILLVACFNIIGSLSMLMIDKKSDVQTLRSLGADNSDICRIFMYEGRLISLLGAVVGIVLGLLLCWLQQTFGFISMGDQSGSFIVEAYPVSVHFVDILLILATVVAVGWVSVWYPVRHLSRRLLNR